MITVTSDLTTNPSAASVVFGPLEDEDGQVIGECQECGESFPAGYEGIEDQLQEAELHLDKHAIEGDD
jgi:hypothetical protein